MSKRSYTDKELEEVSALYNQGLKYEEIAKVMGYPHYKVTNMMYTAFRLGLSERRHKGITRPRYKVEEKERKPGTIYCDINVSKKCIYGLRSSGTYGTNLCNYILITGKMRGCPWSECDKFCEGSRKPIKKSTLGGFRWDK